MIATGWHAKCCSKLSDYNKMIKENYFLSREAHKKLPMTVRSTASCHEVLDSELWEFFKKLEHRAEILMTISQDQRRSGCYELAEAYRRQGTNLKIKTQAMRKLLTGLAE
jgi:hypothetical protein